MSLNEEIQKLNKLLEDGAITQEEFENLNEQLTGVSNETQDNPELTVVNKEKTKNDLSTEMHNKLFLNNFKSISLKVFNEIQNNNGMAGSKIGTSVLYAVLTQVSITIAFLIALFGFIPALLAQSPGDAVFITNTLMYMFMLLAFVFWIAQLSSLNSAGKIFKNRLETLAMLSHIDERIFIIHDPELIELKGLKIGQEFGGGILTFFDKSKNFAVIFAKNDLDGKYTHKEAIDACKRYSSEGYNDWILPSSNEIMLAQKSSKKHSFPGLANSHYCSSDFVWVSVFKDEISFDRFNLSTGLVRPIRIVPL